LDDEKSLKCALQPTQSKEAAYSFAKVFRSWKYYIKEGKEEGRAD